MSDLPSPPPVPRTPGAGPAIVERLRARLANGITHLTSGSGVVLDYSSPPGDPGLFGPDAACWTVHSDFTSMMVGGVSALLLQMLHPLALAGVWDHSTFRGDILGRLRRTATFIAGTTFGNQRDALALIERVKQIHLNVTGIAPDGRPYRADDPGLLTWVHVAEVSSFLAAHLRYRDPLMPRAEQDRYFAETARIATMLGAHDVPQTRDAIDRYLAAMQPSLDAGPRTAEVVRVLMHAKIGGTFTRPAGKLFLHAGADLLPAWAQAMLGLDRFVGLRRTLTRPGVQLIAPVVRWALVNGVSKRARRRAAAAAAPQAGFAASVKARSELGAASDAIDASNGPTSLSAQVPSRASGDRPS